MTRFVVTGAKGFIGQRLCRILALRSAFVIGVARRRQTPCMSVHQWVNACADFVGIEHEWPRDVHGDCVIHLAARVHMIQDKRINSLDIYRKTNVEGTLRIAKIARNIGARRFIFVSSIKAIADTDGGIPLKETDPALPRDPYGASKLDAEYALLQFGRDTGMEIVIVRPPLVYGPAVRANFLKLMHAVARGIPLPLGAINARRSMIFVDNLVDVLVCCAVHPLAASQTFHVSDGHDLTIAELIQILSRQLNVSIRLISVPVLLLRAAGQLTGCSASIDRLVNSLQLDTSHLTSTLGWHAPYSIEEALQKTASWYYKTHRAQNKPC
ncbi:NAD-dependent epimerase/dehydratase family protein [Candidatus Vallotia cooleyia]|uniref:NAD-dependent epimerase/dehydratase family protein n=1 Tax=Candidatus Vallotiella adelgis TaxID=1177211 RepID=UPI001D005BC4|nr:NAD-dependent epimerase/dehydratase family protein [Candidatus Vallotia cooleyia]UDG82439.1 N-acetyl-alpha-D-glucosaminyl-diphospho-ditrans,octacis-undecaprenol 4-epimerase [Candidatus Vallotia cooleyia]